MKISWNSVFTFIYDKVLFFILLPLISQWLKELLFKTEIDDKIQELARLQAVYERLNYRLNLAIATIDENYNQLVKKIDKIISQKQHINDLEQSCKSSASSIKSLDSSLTASAEKYKTEYQRLVETVQSLERMMATINQNLKPSLSYPEDYQEPSSPFSQRSPCYRRSLLTSAAVAPEGYVYEEQEILENSSSPVSTTSPRQAGLIPLDGEDGPAEEEDGSLQNRVAILSFSSVQHNLEAKMSTPGAQSSSL